MLNVLCARKKDHHVRECHQRKGNKAKQQANLAEENYGNGDKGEPC